MEIPLKYIVWLLFPITFGIYQIASAEKLSDINPQAICFATCQLTQPIEPSNFAAQIFRPIISKVASQVSLADEDLANLSPEAHSPKLWNLDKLNPASAQSWIKQLKFLSNYKLLLDTESGTPPLHRVRVLRGKDNIDDFLKLIRTSANQSIVKLDAEDSSRLTSTLLMGTALITAYQLWNHTAGFANDASTYFSSMNLVLSAFSAAAVVDPFWAKSRFDTDLSKVQISRFFSKETFTTSHLSLAFETPSEIFEEKPDYKKSGLMLSLRVQKQKSFGAQAFKKFVCWLDRIRPGNFISMPSYKEEMKTEFVLIDLLKVIGNKNLGEEDKLIVSTITTKNPPRKKLTSKKTESKFNTANSFLPVPNN